MTTNDGDRDPIDYEDSLAKRAGAEDSATLISLLRTMVQIRVFEEHAERLFFDKQIRGGLHLSNGQEAVSVGMCSLLTTADTMTCTYRGHAAVIAKGAPLDRLFGELLGRSGGICRGKGGSMHLTDFSVGALGSFAIVGAHLPISAGAALTAKYRNTGSVSVSFFGDGATNIGTFHETLNLAAVWDLPVIFVCENNLYGEYSPIAVTTSPVRLVDRAAAYRIPAVRVDGNDVLAMREVSETAINRAREGGGPTFIEAMTYRQKGHSARADFGRPPEEVEAWLKRDPIVRLEDAISEAGTLTMSEIDDLHTEVDGEVAAALEIALASPEPQVSELFEDVYV